MVGAAGGLSAVEEARLAFRLLPAQLGDLIFAPSRRRVSVPSRHRIAIVNLNDRDREDGLMAHRRVAHFLAALLPKSVARLDRAECNHVNSP